MVNNLLGVWSTIGSVALAILILLVMITVHEFGHWIAGKILKFKIDEFAIGFGPALFKIKGKKTGQIVSLRLIPLGGYCAFAGEAGEEEEPPDPFLDALSQEITEEAQKQPEQEVAPLSNEKKKKQKKQAELQTFTKKKPWQRIIVLVCGALMNYLLALFLIILCFSVYGQSMVKIKEVAQPTEEYPAAYSFQAGDILLAANGNKLYLTTDVARNLNGKKTGDKMDFVVSRVQSDGSRKEEKITVLLRGDVSIKNSTDFTGVWNALGVGIEDRGEEGKFYTVENANYRFDFWETLGRSFVYSFKIAGSIFRVIGELFTGKLGVSSLGGPITTITVTSKIAAQGFQSFLEIASYIGVNLAVFNLLPIPALDGSKIIFTIIEWIRGKPINRKVEAIIHAVGLVLLIGFAILVDVLQFV